MVDGGPRSIAFAWACRHGQRPGGRQMNSGGMAPLETVLWSAATALLALDLC
jgi:hypothetical protein